MPDVEVVDARIHSLAAMARALGGSQRLLPMLEIAAEEALRALGAASVSVSRVEPGTGTLRTVINTGLLGPAEVRWPQDEVYQLSDFAKLRSVVGDLRTWTTSVTDGAADPEELALLRSLDKASSMASPIVVDGGLWGELYATRGVLDPEFASADTAYLEALSAILAGAVSRALHVEALERLAYLDPLTGLANRRALDEAAASAFRRLPGGNRRVVTVVALDVNGLKTVNDTEGHSEGDLLLTAVARTLAQHFRSLDGSLVARVGGDEFSVLVPDHALQAVIAAADSACAAVRALPWGAGISCGVATTVGNPWRRPQDLFRAADRAQYAAKKAGDTRAVLADPAAR